MSALIHWAESRINQQGRIEPVMASRTSALIALTAEARVGSFIVIKMVSCAPRHGAVFLWTN